MNPLIKLVILAVVQGLTEFLPVSSSGHLVIFKNQLGVESQNAFWEIILHFGTLLAVFIFFRKEILSILKSVIVSVRRLISGGKITDLIRDDLHFRIFLLILVGTIPTGLIAIAFKNTFEALFNKPVLAGLMIMVTGTFLWFTKSVDKKTVNKEGISFIDALIVGVVQGIAIIPGISRSGSTISAACFRGINRGLAARFSFLLSIPAILCATVLEYKEIVALNGKGLFYVAIVISVSALVGYFALRWLVGIVERGRLYMFSYYCWGIGVIGIIISLA
ncbi:MAG TPA: undecaprenyl-diphosphate phosphatase [Candidatus Brocadiia bacterium]